MSTSEAGARNGSGLRGIGLALAVVVLLALTTVFIAGLLDGSRAAGSLESGDCLLAPNEDQIIQVDIVECDEPHELEVIGTVTLAGEIYPGDQAAFEQALEACSTVFDEYLGTGRETLPWFVNTFTPSLEGWEQGERDATCLVFQFDENGDYRTVEGSARNTGA